MRSVEYQWDLACSALMKMRGCLIQSFDAVIWNVLPGHQRSSGLLFDWGLWLQYRGAADDAPTLCPATGKLRDPMSFWVAWQPQKDTSRKLPGWVLLLMEELARESQVFNRRHWSQSVSLNSKMVLPSTSVWVWLCTLWLTHSLTHSLTWKWKNPCL